MLTYKVKNTPTPLVMRAFVRLISRESIARVVGDFMSNNVERLRHAPLLTVLIPLIVLTTTLCARANEDQIPKPQHPIAECRKLDDKKACLKESWAEYKNAILEEYEEWKSLEDDAESDNENRVSAAMRRALDGGWYVHNHWDLLMPQEDEYDEIPIDHATVINDCRTAIINLKFWLVALTGDSTDVSEQRSDYQQSAKLCERGIKKFKLKAE